MDAQRRRVSRHRNNCGGGRCAFGRAHRIRAGATTGGLEMRFDIHRRFQVEVLRVGEDWVAFRLGDGTRVPLPDVMIPANTEPEALASVLDDVFHEYAGPGTAVRRLETAS